MPPPRESPPRSLDARNRAQKEFFEQDPSRVATRVYGDPRFPRTLRKKFAFAARRLHGARRVLELGTGRGRQLPFLLERLGPRTLYYGLDIALDPLPSALRLLTPAERRRVLLSNAQGEALPFADASLDGVFMVDVLHHVRSQAEALTEIRRVLRPGGLVVALEPNPSHPANLIYRNDPIEQGLFLLTPGNVATWCREAGLAEARLRRFPVFFPGFPGWLGPVYEGLERVLGALPFLAPLATTRLLTAVRPG